MDTFIYFFKHGFFHVLDWNAYDHILFLIVLLVAYTFKDFIKTFYFITLFTIGNLMTLLLSTYHVINVNNNYIAFLIPLTIFIFAVYNVFTARKSSKAGKNNFNLIFALFFGLIHGLGSTYEFERIVGNNNKFISSLEFGLGVETGQLVGLVVILFLGFIFQTVFRFSKRDWTMVISSIVIGLVIPMLIANKVW